MLDDDHKKIGSATYLYETNGLYIPFKLVMGGTNCTSIQTTLEKTDQ
jgi:hypothetical protein